MLDVLIGFLWVSHGMGCCNEGEDEVASFSEYGNVELVQTRRGAIAREKDISARFLKQQVCRSVS